MYNIDAVTFVTHGVLYLQHGVCNKYNRGVWRRCVTYKNTALVRTADLPAEGNGKDACHMPHKEGVL